MPTTITISEFQPGPGECNFTGSTAKLRRYYNQDWTDVDGVFHAEGHQNSSTDFFDEIACTLSGNTITVPAFTATPTDNPQTGSTVQETWQLWDQAGTARNVIFEGFIPSAPSPITLGALILLNRGQTLFENDRITRLDQWIQSYIDTVIGLIRLATSVIAGWVRLSVPAANVADPIAVGKNDYSTTSNHGIGRVSTAPASATEPIFYGVNDTHLPTTSTNVFWASQFASFAAAISAIGATPATLIISAAMAGISTVTVPSTLTLVFLASGSIAPTTGQTITIVARPIAPNGKQIFVNALSGQGTISFTGNTSLVEIYPQWWGAVMDDATDDAAAINACIVALGSTATTRGGPRVLITGPTAIGSTILVNRKSIVFAGLGWGRQGSTGQQSYLRWIGSAGSPMLRLQNVQGVVVENLRLIGNASARPSCAISLFQESGFGINANVLRNVAIGNLTDGTQISAGFTIGIAWEGAATNNAEWQFYNISISGCATHGMRQNSIQNVNCVAHGLQITNSVIGVYVTGTLRGTNWNIGANSDTDIVLPIQDDSPQNILGKVHVTGFHSEGSARLLDIKQEGQVSIDGGGFQVGSFTAADGKYIKHEGQGNAIIRLKDFSTSQVSAPPTTPFISILRTSYFNQALDVLILDGVSISQGGPESNGVSAATKGYLDQKFIYYRDIAGNSVDEDGAPITATTNYLGGVFGGGPGMQLNRTDFPGRLRLVPTTQPTVNNTIDAAGDTITANRALVIISNATGGSITLTSAPTIADGANGEIIKVINLGSQNVVLQDQGTLPSSNLRLAAATITLGPRDSIELIFFTTVGGITLGDWVQTGNVVNVV